MNQVSTKRGRRGAALPIYWRDGVAYLDGRRWGKGRQPLRLEGKVRGTKDPVVAERLARELVGSWEEDRTMAARLGLRPGADLATAGDSFLLGLQERKKSDSHARYMYRCLLRALDFFDVVQAEQATTAAERKRTLGPRNLGTISVPDVRAFIRWLRSHDGRRGQSMSDNTVRAHLTALSGVFTQAISDGHLKLGCNPVAALLERPSGVRSPTQLLEPGECALLLEAARTIGRNGPGNRVLLACVYPLLAFYLYTGARDAEVRRAHISDLHFDPTPAYPNGWIRIRGTKTEGSERAVPMHPHHVEILRAHLRTTGRVEGLLFTTTDGGPVGDWRKTLDAVARRAGYADGEIRTRRFRASYASHRSTCDDADANTVRLELGHSDLHMMARVYVRAQRSSERMGTEFTYRLDRWAHLLERSTLERLSA
jgi:integrase